MAEFSPPPLRAPVACVACNKKKVRCIFNDEASTTCVNCERHQWPCFLRESKRKRPQNESESDAKAENRKRRQHSIDESLRTPLQSGIGSPLIEGVSDTPNNPTPSPCTTSGIHTHPAQYPAVADISPASNPYSSASSVSFMARSRYFEHTAVINEDQARSYPIGDADGPTDDDIQILRLQGAFELPPRAVRDGLINTFMERCAPWMPIIERSWLEQSGSQQPSLLLLQSVFLAASRVTSAPAVSAYASTHQFYRRAKALFWSGYEKNPVTVVAAVCILHWYNPEGPEHVSTNTSGFWRYVGVGLAHQIGLHKEPTNKRDAALRRRLWWTLFVRDCLVSAGQGRPMAVHVADCELAPPCPEDFRDSSADSGLFIAYVEISSILGHLTEHCRRKTLTRQTRQDIENRLYRWTRDLPPDLRLFNTQSDSSGHKELKLSRYSFEARQLHIPYFVCLALIFRPSPGNSPSSAVVLASAFVAWIFEDFLARDETQFLGPIFTFHLLVAGIGIITSNTTPGLLETTAASIETIYLSLEVLSKRWSSAKGSLRALKNISEKQHATRSEPQEPLTLLREHKPFFEGFGPDLCWAWSCFAASEDGQGVQEQDVSRDLRADDPPIQGSVQSRAADTLSPPEEYRPLTSVLDPRVGFDMADLSQGMGEAFFHNQYRGMGDWLFNDLDWDVDTCI